MDQSLLQLEQGYFSKVFINSYSHICAVKLWSLALLRHSHFSKDIPHIVKCFDNTTKLRFKNRDVPQRILFGNRRDNDPEVNIRAGELKLLGYAFNICIYCDLRHTISSPSSDVASFFEPSIQCIVRSIKDQCEASNSEISVRNLSGLTSCVLLTSLLKVYFPCGRFCCERLAFLQFESWIYSSGHRRQPSWKCVRLLRKVSRSDTNNSSVTNPSLTVLYPSILIILCRRESRSLRTG